MSSQLAALLKEMREGGDLSKTAAAPGEPTAVDAGQNQDALAVASDVLGRIGNFLQAGQQSAEPAGVTEGTPQQGPNQAGDQQGTGEVGSTKVNLEIPQGMTIKVAGEINNREDAFRLIAGLLPEALFD